MKKFLKSVSAALVLVLSLTVLVACEKTVPYATVTRDPSNIGGEELTFSYDEDKRVATFGGAGQTVAYYEEDLSLGRAAGNRVGLQITAPKEIDNFDGIKLKVGDKEHTGDFLDGDNFFWYYPLVSADKMEIKFDLKWNKEVKSQSYKVVIVAGTLFEAAPEA